MTELTIFRGVPGSGKTTKALFLAKNPNTVRVNRDDIRFTLFGKYWGVDEQVVTEVENTAIESALRAGQHVLVDATNLNNKALKTKLSLASRYGATVRFKDFPVDLATAIARDKKRERSVGADVIMGFFKRYKVDSYTGALPKAPEALPLFERYIANTDLPMAFIVDTDGTVADSDGVRNPYDTSKYADDRVRTHVAHVVTGLNSLGTTIIGLSGRDEEFREVTEKWWTETAELSFDEFFMRPLRDKRMDAIVKYELFRNCIAPKYNVVGAFDDRPQVIRMWETIGVPVFNVGNGIEF